MSELEVISRTPSPRTRHSLATDLHQLGLASGAVVLVHSSLSALGWVCGGAVAVVQALLDVVTESGTVVVPTHSGDYSDPAKWCNPTVPGEWQKIIRKNMPVFDPQVTPTRGMGQIVEVFRTWSGVRRSSHPTVSFAAWGQDAEAIVKGHSLVNSLGEESPLARLYELNAWVLLLGVGYDCSTCFHLAEYRSGRSKRVLKGAPILTDGQRVWKNYQDIEFDTDDFTALGEEFERTGQVNVSNVGSARARLFSIEQAVDFAIDWFG